jgi:hypothetical protein
LRAELLVALGGVGGERADEFLAEVDGEEFADLDDADGGAGVAAGKDDPEPVVADDAARVDLAGERVGRVERVFVGRDEVPDAREDVRGRGRLLDRERGGERAFKVDGKALRIRDTLVLEDASSGAELYRSRRRGSRSATRWRSSAEGRRLRRSRRR